jgi:hypothetical protein
MIREYSCAQLTPLIKNENNILVIDKCTDRMKCTKLFGRT